MRHACLFPVTLFLAATATAQPAEWNYDGLRDDLRMSRVLDLGVVSLTDQPIGRVRNVVLDRGGNFEAMSVEFDHVGGDALALALFDWSDVSIQPEQDAVTVSLGVSATPASVTSPIAARGIDVRQLIGLPVSLRGEPFGEVNDILFEASANAPSAIIVETRDGASYALPPPDGSLDVSAGLSYDLAPEHVRELGEFELSAAAR